MSKILISGGSGLIGRAVSKLLIQNNHQVVWLSREEGNWQGIKKYQWDWTQNKIDESAFDEVDVVINLSGAGIMDKAWTKDYKKLIIDSRVKSSEFLFNCIQKKGIRLKSYIGASGVGYYGSEISKEVFHEGSGIGTDFLASTCKKWENAQAPFKNISDQFVVFRIGAVLDKTGGTYPKMAKLFNYGLGSPYGSGKQLLPWIHSQDLSNLFLFALNNQNVNGTYNAVSSEIVSNRYFSELLAKSLRKSLFLPNVPEFILKLFLGERSKIITKGLIISNLKIINAGFKFDYPDLKRALNELKAKTST